MQHMPTVTNVHGVPYHAYTFSYGTAYDSRYPLLYNTHMHSLFFPVYTCTFCVMSSLKRKKSFSISFS